MMPISPVEIVEQQHGMAVPGRSGGVCAAGVLRRRVLRRLDSCGLLRRRTERPFDKMTCVSVCQSGSSESLGLCGPRGLASRMPVPPFISFPPLIQDPHCISVNFSALGENVNAARIVHRRTLEVTGHRPPACPGTQLPCEFERRRTRGPAVQTRCRGPGVRCFTPGN